MQGFSEPTELYGTNKENIALDDSAKLTETLDTEESERSGTTGSAERGCPNSGSWGRFPAAVADAQLGLETRAKGRNPYHLGPTETRRHGRQCGTRTCHRHDNHSSFGVED